MAPFSYARRAILWRHNMVPFNGAILWHVCTRHKAFLLCENREDTDGRTDGVQHLMRPVRELGGEHNNGDRY